MNLKPFRPPSFKRAEADDNATASGLPPPAKKRRLTPPENQDVDAIAARATHKPAKQDRPPLKSVPNPPSPGKDSGNNGNKKFFSIVFRKVTAKKHKTWEEDGVLVYNNGLATAYNSKGQRLGATTRDKGLDVDDVFSLSGKDMQIEAEISKDDFSRIVGRDNAAPKDENVVIMHGQPTKVTVHPTTKPAHKMSLQEQMRQQIQKSSIAKASSTSKTPMLPQARNTAFTQPLKDNQVLPQEKSEQPIPRHDPHSKNALVLQRPAKAPTGKQIVDVVLDPLLTTKLRDHQRAGVQFLYECVMGLRDFSGQGCILADDMGLGKTLQTIALIWTLVKQNPIYKDPPLVKKVLIVCPVTLVQNWKKEFRKWLGRDKLGVMSFGDEGSRLGMFDGRNFKVMIVGYERLQKIAEDLNRGASIDLVICDEGHRLKSLQNKSAKAIETLNTSRRIILSGTPIQNDLTEFFAMVNFVNDGVLGSWKGFQKDYEKPIMRSRQPNATQNDVENGQAASEDLTKTTCPFILRRTADILAQYLPPKTEYVLFCRPTRDQATVYKAVLQTAMCKEAVGSKQAALQMITILKKLCNSPALLAPKTGADDDTSSDSLNTLLEEMPRGMSRFYANSCASKIRVLDELLHHIHTETDDKIVLVSNYTATLDLIENLLNSQGMTYRRIDGSVPANKRQSLVDEFNRSSPSACFAFLLSAKAGGQGINLIGGNRLVLFDVDWNPATDDQAMARIHREGQQKACYIYRLVMKGALEERIWQRQVVKRGLAASIMEGGAAGKQGKDKSPFSMEELKDLFRLDESDGLKTHELIDCQCGGRANAGEGKNDSDGGDTIADIEDLDSDIDDRPLRTFSFTSASQVTEQDLEEQERSISTSSSPRKASKKKKEDIELEQALMKYSHLDTAAASELEEEDLQAMTDVVDDACLMHVLKQGQETISGNISYVFMKRSKVSNMEAENDDEG